MNRFARAWGLGLALLLAAGMAAAKDIPGVGPAQLASAKAALVSAQLVVIGMQQDDYELEMTIAGLVEGDLGPAIKAGEFSYNDAVAVLKEKSAFYGRQLVHNAFLEVYGRHARPQEMELWESKVVAKQAWFAVIVVAETKKLNSDAFVRRRMVEDTYLAAFGRIPTVAELGYWMPRTEHYSSLYEAARSFLYSANGAKDRNETLARAFEVSVDGLEVEPVRSMKNEVVGKRMTFDEIVKWHSQRH